MPISSNKQPKVSQALRAGFGVAGLRGGGRQVEAQGIGVVFAEEVGHLHESAAALAQLRTFEVEVFMATRDKCPSP
jgi:hypothetical protein